MTHSRVMLVAAIAAISLVLAGVPLAGAAPSTVVVTGTIQSAASGTLVLTGNAGRTQVLTTDKTLFISRKAAQLSDIKVGDFIGVDAKKSASGSLSAVSINIFPAGSQGRIRVGQWLMDSGDTMTNAVVAQYVAGVSSRTITLTYQGGTATIAVPPATEMHHLLLVTFADLKPGLHVTVRGQRSSDGSVTATFISIDQPGM